MGSSVKEKGVIMKSVLEYLESSAEKNPDKMAVCDENCNMTYIQLQQSA